MLNVLKHLLTLSIIFISFSWSDEVCIGEEAIIGMHGCVTGTGIFIPLNTTAEIDCKLCECDELGNLSCCSIGVTGLIYPPYCKEVPDGPCNKKAVFIKDPSVPCDKSAVVG